MELKRVERVWKMIWLRALTRLARPSTTRRTEWGARPHHVLFLRHDRVGDMILSTGVIRAVAESWPTITVDVLASPLNAPVLREAPYVGAVLTFDRGRPWTYPGLVWRLRHARYDAVIDCMVTAPSLTTLLLMLASGARRRVGVAGRGMDAMLTDPVPAARPEARHMLERLAALSAAFGARPPDGGWRPEIALSPREQDAALRVWGGVGASGPRWLVNVSAGRSFRRWPDDRYVAVIHALRERDAGARILVVGVPRERDRAAEIARAGGASVAATPNLRDALALIATADFVFTPDTSIAHAASAFGTPAVAMYVRGTAEAWGLVGTRGANVTSVERTLDALPLGPVRAALDEVLCARGDRRPDAETGRELPASAGQRPERRPSPGGDDAAARRRP